MIFRDEDFVRKIERPKDELTQVRRTILPHFGTSSLKHRIPDTGENEGNTLKVVKADD
jgi:hypothetical protein